MYGVTMKFSQELITHYIVNLYIHSYHTLYHSHKYLFLTVTKHFFQSRSKYSNYYSFFFCFTWIVFLLHSHTIDAI